MPKIKRKPNETKKDFLARCIPIELNRLKAKDENKDKTDKELRDISYSICETYFDDSLPNASHLDNVLNRKSVLLNMVKDEKINGRIRVKFVSHEIFSDPSETQDNGINYMEEYVENNLKSAIGSSIKVCYSEYGEPTGHGEIKAGSSGKLVDYTSEIVGSTVNAYIDNFEQNGITKRGLICEGYIDTMVHSYLGEWLLERFNNGEPISLSNELIGKGDSNYIIFDEDAPSDVLRPMVYDYAANTIITVRPGDRAAKMAYVNTKKKEEYDLNLEEAKAKIKELEQSLQNTEKVIAEKDELIQTNEVTHKEALSKKDEEINSLQTKVNEVNTINNELSLYKEKNEAEKIVAKFDEQIKNGLYTAEIVETQSEQIKDFRENATNEKSESIINSLNAEIIKALSNSNNGNIQMVNTKEKRYEDVDKSTVDESLDAYLD